MDFSSIVFIILGTLLFGGLVACAYFGKDYLRYHKAFSPVLEILCSCIKGISGMLPDNATLMLLSVVLNAAVEATEMAERLWLDGTLDKEQRNIYAKNYIAGILEKAKIEPNGNINSIVDGVIAFVCYLLPHGQEPVHEDEEE